MLSDWRENKCRHAVPVAVSGENSRCVAHGHSGADDAGKDADGGCPNALHAWEEGGVRMACSPLARARGLMAYPSWRGVLILAPCADIHTCFVKSCIDVAFADAGGIVLEACQGLPPWRRRRCRGACFTLERWADPTTAWFERGQSIRVMPRNKASN